MSSVLPDVYRRADRRDRPFDFNERQESVEVSRIDWALLNIRYPCLKFGMFFFLETKLDRPFSLTIPGAEIARCTLGLSITVLARFLSSVFMTSL